MVDLSSKGQLALSYARERAWYVFPVTENSKTPPKIGGWPEKATVDLGVIEAWWRKWPDANIGIATGPSGLLVLDIDNKNGKDGSASLGYIELENGSLPTTLIVNTPTGGQHLYYRGSAADSVEKIGRGIDVRAAKGYVVAPGSIINDGEYTWANSDASVVDAPEWLTRLAGQPRAKPPHDMQPLSGELDSKADVSRAVSFLLNTTALPDGSGSDRQTYVVACKLRDMGLSEEMTNSLMSLVWTSDHDLGWIAQKVRNAYAYAEGIAGADSVMSDFNEPPDGHHTDVWSQWVLVPEAVMYVRRKDKKRYSPKQFDAAFNHLTEGRSASNCAQGGKVPVRKVECIDYRPGEAEFLDGGTAYNIWHSSGITPVQGDVSWFLDHLAYMFPDENERERLIDYLAYMLQKPGDKIMFAPIIQGGQGVGKSFLGALMSIILGEHNVTMPSNDDLAGQWNSWLLGCQLAVVEELMTLGRRDTANKLKPLITQERIRVNEKYLNPYEVRNRANFLMFTNHEDALKIDNGDRRYFVMFSPAKPKPESYYGELWAHLNGDGPAHVAQFLVTRDLSNFNPKGRAPETAAKKAMARASLPEISQQLLELYELGMAPFDKDAVTMSELIAVVASHSKVKVRNLNGTLTNFLRETLGAEKIDGVWLSDGSRTHLWVIRKHEEWTSMSKPEAGARYEASLRSVDKLLE